MIYYLAEVVSSHPIEPNGQSSVAYRSQAQVCLVLADQSYTQEELERAIAGACCPYDSVQWFPEIACLRATREGAREGSTWRVCLCEQILPAAAAILMGKFPVIKMGEVL